MAEALSPAGLRVTAASRPLRGFVWGTVERSLLSVGAGREILPALWTAGPVLVVFQSGHGDLLQLAEQLQPFPAEQKRL